MAAGAVLVALLTAACGPQDAVTPGAPPPATADPTASAFDNAALAAVLTASTVVAISASWRVAAPAGADSTLADDVAAVLCAADARWVSGGVEQLDREPGAAIQRVWGLAIPDMPRDAWAELSERVQERAAVERVAFGNGLQEAEVVHVELLIPAPFSESSEETGPAVVREAVVQARAVRSPTSSQRARTRG